MRKCPNCKTEQLYDVIWGYANHLCPDFCLHPYYAGDRQSQESNSEDFNIALKYNL